VSCPHKCIDNVSDGLGSKTALRQSACEKRQAREHILVVRAQLDERIDDDGNILHTGQIVQEKSTNEMTQMYPSIFGMKHHLSSTRHASMFQPMAKTWLWVLAATEPAHLRPLQQLTWPAFTNNSIYLCVYWTPTNLPIPVRGTRLGTASGWRGNERRSNNGTPIRGGQIV
jgi:hypothetical protein